MCQTSTAFNFYHEPVLFTACAHEKERLSYKRKPQANIISIFSQVMLAGAKRNISWQQHVAVMHKIPVQHDLLPRYYHLLLLCVFQVSLVHRRVRDL